MEMSSQVPRPTWARTSGSRHALRSAAEDGRSALLKGCTPGQARPLSGLCPARMSCTANWSREWENKNYTARAFGPRKTAFNDPIHWQQVATASAYAFVTVVRHILSSGSTVGASRRFRHGLYSEMLRFSARQLDAASCLPRSSDS